MDPRHIEVLRKSRLKISGNVYDVEALVDQLYARGVVTDFQKDNILAESSKKLQLRELIDILLRRGKSAFHQFVWCLEICKEKDLASELARDGRISLTDPDLDQSSGKPSETRPIEEKLVDKYEVWPKPEDTKLFSEVTVCEKEEFHDLMSKENTYNITQYKKKTLIWIMNPKFDDSESKSSFDHDSTKFDTVVKKLCDAELKSNFFHGKSGQEMVEIFKEKFDKTDFSKYGCFMIYAHSYGPDPSKVYGKEGNVMDLGPVLEKMRNCPALKDKPKVIIIHTCEKSKSEKSSSAHPGEMELDAARTEITASEATVTETTVETQENEDDIFVIYGKPKKGYNMWIGGKHMGSYYLQCLLHVMAKYCCKLSFTEIIDKVNKQLCHTKVDDTDRTDEVAEVCYLHRCNKKKLYFFPGMKPSPVDQPHD